MRRPELIKTCFTSSMSRTARSIFNPRVPADRERLVDAVSEAAEGATALPSVAFYGSGEEGDVVRVIPGTACPGAPDLDLSGWQGWVIDLTEANDASEPAIGFAWDSSSLRAMPAWFIEDAECDEFRRGRELQALRRETKSQQDERQENRSMD